MKRLRIFIGFVSFGLMVITTIAVMRSAYGRLFVFELFLGWFVAVANALAAFLINRRAVPASESRPWSWGLGMNGIRVGALLVIILGLQLLRMPNFMPFVVTVSIGYFWFMFAEVLRLHTESLNKTTLGNSEPTNNQV